MGIVDTLKETVGLLQKVDNIELYRRMVELQTEIYSVVEENRTLKEKLATREKLTFRRNCYWLGDDGPFCSRCWDVESKLVRMHISGPNANPMCPSCTTLARDPSAPPDQPGRTITDEDEGPHGWMAR